MASPANGRRAPGEVMHESAGRAAALGAGVTALDVGQPATFNPVVVPDADVDRYAGREQRCPDKYVIGVLPADVVAAFAEYVVAPARNVVALPADVPIEHGALVEPIAVHAVRRVDAQAGASALVVGGGPSGSPSCSRSRRPASRTSW